MRLPLYAAALAASTTLAFAQNPRTSQQLDTSAGANNMGGVASQGDNTVVFWKDSTTNEVWSARSTTCGKLWSSPIRVDRDATNAGKFTGFQNGTETIHVNGDHVYVFWNDDRDGDTNVYFTRSTNGGASYGITDVRLDKGLLPVGGNDVRELAVAVVKNADPNLDKLHVLMSVENDTTNFSEDVFLTSSLDGGATWNAAVPILVSTFDNDAIGLGADGTNVYVAYDDDRNGQDDLFLRVSNDDGATFGAEIQLDGSGPAAGNINSGDNGITIAANGNLVVVGWQEQVIGTVDEAHVRVSLDGGATFLPDQIVGQYTPGLHDVDAFTATLVGTNIVCVWDDNRVNSFDEVYTTTSTDSGLTWSADAEVSVNSGGFARITRDSATDVGIFFSGDFPNLTDGVYSTDGGLTWSSRITVNTTTGDTDFVECAFNATDRNFVVGWEADDLAADHIYTGGFSLGTASVANRTAGPNPASYTAGNAILGEMWTGTVDLSGTGHSMAIVVGYKSPGNMALPQGDVLLVSGQKFFATGMVAGPIANFSAMVPNEACLNGVTVYTQAAHVGGVTPYRATNAQDLTMGAF